MRAAVGAEVLADAQRRRAAGTHGFLPDDDRHAVAGRRRRRGCAGVVRRDERLDVVPVVRQQRHRVGDDGGRHVRLVPTCSPASRVVVALHVHRVLRRHGQAGRHAVDAADDAAVDELQRAPEEDRPVARGDQRAGRLRPVVAPAIIVRAPRAPRRTAPAPASGSVPLPGASCRRRPARRWRSDVLAGLSSTPLGSAVGVGGIDDVLEAVLARLAGSRDAGAHCAAFGVLLFRRSEKYTM